MAERTPNKQGLESVIKIIEQVCDDICDNYCMYKDTVDEECLCDVTRNGGRCPLDRLIQDLTFRRLKERSRSRWPAKGIPGFLDRNENISCM